MYSCDFIDKIQTSIFCMCMYVHVYVCTCVECNDKRFTDTLYLVHTNQHISSNIMETEYTP